MIAQIIKILGNNRNIILTGAPGTGKTFTAKEIAKQILNFKDDELKESGQFEFVQFHPSYDYTDFVEGLRPFKKEGQAEIGFELKDGIFKEFCKKAAENIINSNKTKEDLSKFNKAKENIIEFLSNSQTEGIKFKLKSGNEFIIESFDDKRVILNNLHNETSKEIIFSFSEFLKLVESQTKVEQVNDIKKYFNRRHNRQSDSYVYTLFNDKGLDKELNNITLLEAEEKKKYIFVIDEINRGEISKIFGELFFSIDPGYRGEKGRVKTQYSNIQEYDDVFKDGFYVPENVYIIGTMNDIDRSVDSMDFAMRRRFAFKEVTAEDSQVMFRQYSNHKSYFEVIKKMNSLNSAIVKIDGLNSHYHIGASYFLQVLEKNQSFDDLWNYKLKGVLFEYLRGMPDVEGKIKSLEDAYTNG